MVLVLFDFLRNVLKATMRRPLARLLMVAWGVGTFFISLRLFTGHVPMDLSLSAPEDPVHRRQQLMRDLKALVSKGNLTGWKEYLQYQMTDTRIWPEPGEKEDRVLNQIHLVHADPAGEFILRYVNDGLK